MKFKKYIWHVVGFATIGFSAWLLFHELRGLSLDDLWDSLKAIRVRDWLCSGLSTLLAYAATKGAIANFTGGLAQLLAEKGIRVNSVAPGPIWTPLIPATMPPDEVESFGQQVPMKRPGQPAEVAPVYVLLASSQGSYISGARIAVTGGTPIL